MMKQIFSGRRRLPFLIFFAFVFLLSIIGLIVFPSQRTGPFGIGLPARMKTFLGQSTKFSIDYPESWVAFETPNGNHGKDEVIATINVPGRTFPQAYLSLLIFQDINLSKVAAWGDDQRKDANKYKVISSDTLVLSNSEGLLREYSWETGSSPIIGFGEIPAHCYDWYTLKNMTGYIISLCSEEKDWPVTKLVFRQMIESFSVH